MWLASSNASAQQTADQTLATLTRPSPVSAYGGVLAWSDYNAAIGRYRLITQTGPEVAAVPVATRTVPFDVDVGPDASGRPVLLYSRCAHEPPGFSSFTGLPAWRFGSRCDIYEYQPFAKKERRLNHVSSRHRSETLPSIWKDRIAFAGVDEPDGGLPTAAPSIYETGLARGAVTRLRGGTSGTITRSGRSFTEAPGFTTLELRGTEIAFSWEYRGRSCAAADPNGDDPLDPPLNTQVWRTDTSGHRQLLDAGCNKEGAIAAGFTGDDITWLRQTNGQAKAEFRSTNAAINATPAPYGVLAQAYDGQPIAVAVNQTTSAYELQRLAAFPAGP